MRKLQLQVRLLQDSRGKKVLNTDVFGNPLSVNETDKEWTVLLDEIDDLQHWMVQQKSKENLLKSMQIRGNQRDSVESMTIRGIYVNP